MSQKVEFIEKAIAPGANVSALCREFRISRQTAHKWLRRFRAEGYLGLVEQSRRPASSPLATAEDLVVGIIELRGKHPSWGAHKIARVLARQLGPDAPSSSTVARVLHRLGKLKRRRPPARVWSVEGRPRVEVKAPNDLWTIDAKGWWRALNGERCEPLTVRDAFSRKILAIELVASTTAPVVQRVLERLFKNHGLPSAIQSDNGSPFICTRARGGLTILSAWIVSLGIRIVRSRPGHPEDNGAHERMHRDVVELQTAPARSRRAQQRQCDRWMLDFNHVRPHDALDGKTPSELYKNSTRRSVSPLVPTYPAGWVTRRANKAGYVRIGGDQVFVTSAVARQLIGLRQDSEWRWSARFFDVDLETIEVLPIDHAFVGRTVIETVTAVRSAGGASVAG